MVVGVVQAMRVVPVGIEIDGLLFDDEDGAAKF